MTASTPSSTNREELVVSSPPTQLSVGQKLGFALAIILGIGGLAVAGVGVAGYFKLGSLNYLDPTHTIVMMAGGGGGGVILLTIALVGSMRNHPDGNGVASTFIESVRQFDNSTIRKSVSGIYVLSNETGIAESIRVIENEATKNTSKCHLGVGALHNFDIMAARRSECGILFDFNFENKDFILYALEMIREFGSPTAFVEAMITYMRASSQKYNHYAQNDHPIQRLQAELDRPTSWLYRGDRTGKYQHIRNLVRANQITAITQDFCDTEAFQGLVGTLQARGYTLDTLYLSNLYAYIGLEQFHRTFDVLSESAPLVIHCTPPADCACKGGCQCPKQQLIGRAWEHTDKHAGAIRLKDNFEA